MPLVLPLVLRFLPARELTFNVQLVSSGWKSVVVDPFQISCRWARASTEHPLSVWTRRCCARCDKMDVPMYATGMCVQPVCLKCIPAVWGSAENCPVEEFPEDSHTIVLRDDKIEYCANYCYTCLESSALVECAGAQCSYVMCEPCVKKWNRSSCPACTRTGFDVGTLKDPKQDRRRVVPRCLSRLCRRGVVPRCLSCLCRRGGECNCCVSVGCLLLGAFLLGKLMNAILLPAGGLGLFGIVVLGYLTLIVIVWVYLIVSTVYQSCVFLVRPSALEN